MPKSSNHIDNLVGNAWHVVTYLAWESRLFQSCPKETLMESMPEAFDKPYEARLELNKKMMLVLQQSSLEEAINAFNISCHPKEAGASSGALSSHPLQEYIAEFCYPKFRNKPLPIPTFSLHRISTADELHKVLHLTHRLRRFLAQTDLLSLYPQLQAEINSLEQSPWMKAIQYLMPSPLCHHPLNQTYLETIFRSERPDCLAQILISCHSVLAFHPHALREINFLSVQESDLLSHANPAEEAKFLLVQREIFSHYPRVPAFEERLMINKKTILSAPHPIRQAEISLTFYSLFCSSYPLNRLDEILQIMFRTTLLEKANSLIYLKMIKTHQYPMRLAEGMKILYDHRLLQDQFAEWYFVNLLQEEHPLALAQTLVAMKEVGLLVPDMLIFYVFLMLQHPQRSKMYQAIQELHTNKCFNQETMEKILKPAQDPLVIARQILTEQDIARMLVSLSTASSPTIAIEPGDTGTMTTIKRTKHPLQSYPTLGRLLSSLAPTIPANSLPIEGDVGLSFSMDGGF